MSGQSDSTLRIESGGIIPKLPRKKSPPSVMRTAGSVELPRSDEMA
jgi:hypothetical protein